jgi:hypothetical protein
LIALGKQCIDFSSTKILTYDIWMNCQLLEEMRKKASVKVNLHDVRVLSCVCEIQACLHVLTGLIDCLYVVVELTGFIDRQHWYAHMLNQFFSGFLSDSQCSWNPHD